MVSDKNLQKSIKINKDQCIKIAVSAILYIPQYRTKVSRYKSTSLLSITASSKVSIPQPLSIKTDILRRIQIITASNTVCIHQKNEEKKTLQIDFMQSTGNYVSLFGINRPCQHNDGKKTKKKQIAQNPNKHIKSRLHANYTEILIDSYSMTFKILIRQWHRCNHMIRYGIHTPAPLRLHT